MKTEIASGVEMTKEMTKEMVRAAVEVKFGMKNSNDFLDAVQKGEFERCRDFVCWFRKRLNVLPPYYNRKWLDGLEHALECSLKNREKNSL